MEMHNWKSVSEHISQNTFSNFYLQLYSCTVCQTISVFLELWAAWNCTDLADPGCCRKVSESASLQQAPTALRLMTLYVSKLSSVFVLVAQCVCRICKMYLFNFPSVFAQPAADRSLQVVPTALRAMTLAKCLTESRREQKPMKKVEHLFKVSVTDRKTEYSSPIKCGRDHPSVKKKLKSDKNSKMKNTLCQSM